MTQIQVLDANNAPQNIELPPAPGRALAAGSRPVVLSNEDKAVMDAIAASLVALGGNTDGIEGLLTAIGAALTTQAGYLDGVEGLLGGQGTTLTSLQTLLTAIQTLLTTHSGYLDGVEPALDLIDTDLDTVNAQLASLVAASTAPITDMPHAALDKTNDLLPYKFDWSDAAEKVIMPAVAGQTNRAHRYRVTAYGAVDVDIYDGDVATGTKIDTLPFPAAGSYVFGFDSRPYYTTSANKALTFKPSAAVRVVVSLRGTTSA
jgi:hypothetical protein